MRFFKFSAVGLLGAGLQIAALAVFVSTFRWPIIPSTLAAVEMAILHNYCWHIRFTWRDRGHGLQSLLRFHAGNGCVSLIGNVFINAILIRYLPPALCSVVAIAICAVANFLLADRWVYQNVQ